MQNTQMKKLLLFIRENHVIKEYESLFDKMFDFESLFKLKNSDVSDIVNSDMPSVKLYELVNNIKIDDNITDYIYHLKDVNFKKYALRIAASNIINNEDKFEYIRSLCHSKNVNNARYTYSLIMNDSIRNNENCKEYVDIVSKSNSEVSVQIRDLLFENTFFENDKILDVCKIVSKADKEYIARYMIELYKNKVLSDEAISLEDISVLLYSKGIKQASYTYELLNDDEFINRKDHVLIAFFIANANFDYQAYNGYMAMNNEDIKNKDDILTTIIDLVNAEKEYYSDTDINLKEVIKERDISKLLDALNYIPNGAEINSDMKIKRK